jgi:hypothetical protein
MLVVSFALLLPAYIFFSRPISFFLNRLGRLFPRTSRNAQFVGSVAGSIIAGGLMLILSGYFLANTYFSLVETVQSIKQGEQASLEVRYRSFKGSAGQATEPDVRLIGATQKAFFFYDDENNKRTIVIPQAQLISVEVPE